MSTCQILLGIASGVVIFIIGQAFLRFVIEPFQEIHRLRGEITSALIFYANIIVNTQPLEAIAEEAAKLFRQHASRLMALMTGIPFYRFWSGLRIVPTSENIRSASAELIGLSNYIYRGQQETGEGSYRARRLRVASVLRLTLGE